MKHFKKQKNRNRRLYWSVISLVSLSCGGTALAQGDSLGATNNPVATGLNATNAVPAQTGTNVTELGNITVIGRLDQARSQIMPDLGATAYTHTAQQIEMQSQGDDAPFNQVILRSPGVAQDSAANGDLHVRGEHANLQYRINDVLLPEGISGFGLELDPRFVESLQLITGSLPAQYGFRTAGVVDIQTKTGAFANGGSAEMYGGSHDTLRPSFEYGGTQGNWNYFLDGSYEHNDLGIENTTASPNAIHDNTDQYKTFLYASRILSDTSRITLMGSASYADFQVPINPDQQIQSQADGNPWTPQLDPTLGLGNPTPNDLNDNQNEQNYYGVAAYQLSAGDFNTQLSAFGRSSSAHYVPGDVDASLYYNGGEASDEARTLYSGGIEDDTSYNLGDKHTIRGGFMGMEERVQSDTTTWVFPTTGGVATAPMESITQDNAPHALFAGIYLQDEWKILPKVTINYGARFDEYSSSSDNENQLSPRINMIYQPFDKTTLHAGYSRYFTPPPLETVPSGDITAFNGTTGQAGYTNESDTVKCERANYYDAGITQKLLPGLQVGLDGYYKTAQQQLDDGLFGQSLILSSFNYAQGRIYGGELTANYDHGGFSAYGNLACSVAQGRGASSAQYLWPDQGTVDYVNSHWIYLDHDQRISATCGVSYLWKEGDNATTSVYSDFVYGSGLRADGGPIPGDPGDNIPNGSELPNYCTLNLGVSQSYKIHKNQVLKLRLDIVNVADASYELRDGTGVGVNAAQYGARIGFFGSISYTF